nr:MAG TPA: hypothetical protein [Bacteriophage sp.]
MDLMIGDMLLQLLQMHIKICRKKKHQKKNLIYLILAVNLQKIYLELIL